MSIFKYRLVESDEEENGLKSLKTKSELVLVAGEDFTADDFIKIINDPKNLEGYAIVSQDLKDFKQKVFGDRPNIVSTTKTNVEIYNSNGKSLYNDIEAKTGEKFDKKGAIIKKDKTGKTIFVFPQKNSYNDTLVEKYFNLINSEKKTKRSSIKYTKIDDNTLKFPMNDESTLKKILAKAITNGDITSKDYTLQTVKTI